VALVVVLLIAAYYGIRALTAAGNGQLKASGTIEAVMVDLAPEMAGKVRTVLVEEGEQVAAGAPLVILDDALIMEQRKAAEAELESAEAAAVTSANALDIARAQYQQVLEAALLRGRESRLDDWFAKDQARFDQPEWYFSRGEQIEAMQAQIDQSRQDWTAAEARLQTVLHLVNKAEFLDAEKRLLAARIAYLVHKDVNERAQNSTDEDAPAGRFNRTHCGTNQGYRLADKSIINVIYRCTGDEHLSDVSERLFDDARTELDAAQRAYDQLLTSQAAEEVLAARAEVAVAQERYYAALDRLSALQTSDFDPAVTTAQAAVDQAQAAHDLSLKQIARAQAGVDLVNVQLGKLTLFAPMDGVILTRSVEPGEFVQPGAVSISMADLGQLTITVYVPEDRYGQIRRGQLAIVQVDSFPSLVFNARVTHIADEAEFTPRNVQTVEGRSSTVYAVKLVVTDPEGRLKPGMPADVTFEP
jgi:multidrug efflux pump subunit AcrA (membrane-fusion protein)